MTTYAEAESFLSKVKVQILMKSTFFSTIMLSLQTKITTKIPTAATDGDSLLFNPDFLTNLTLKEGVGLMLHELEHIAFGHPTRRGTRAPKKWNIAADYAINNVLDDQGYELPQGGMIDHDLDGKSAEAVYKVIPEPDDSAIPGTGDDILEPADPTATAQNTKEILVQASQASKLSPKPGERVPEALQRVIEELLQPKIPWQTVLVNYMNEMCRETNSWKRPNRRHQAQGLYLPSKLSPTIRNLTVVQDSSGSVTQEEFLDYMSETEHLRSLFDLQRLRLLCVDTDVRSDIEIAPSDSLLDQELYGGGGTDFTSVFELLEKDPPTILIFFSDLGVYWDFDPPSFPVIWINSYDSDKAPSEYGETINIPPPDNHEEV